MKAKLFQNKIHVKKSSIHGYGVFAKENIQKGDIVEECYSLVVTESVDLVNYCFQGPGKTRILPLGFGVIYNHSDNPNIEYDYDPEKKIMIFTALREIKAGEELLNGYGEKWFSERKIKMLRPYKFRMISNSILVRTFLVTAILFTGLHYRDTPFVKDVMRASFAKYR